ncbi:MAG TPA: acyl-CoA dehydrogenase family protein [Acidobacteriota bacterium]|nr:acyl-CoA dehydrogenase family protein [Acidobacteriota bacterium]HNB73414.1 acyl-CoA dehydrogenase family protein [Acidobacteriota bacterium]HND20555.1 acyl-CoA dehydrogenase family protein [Acidobacteriota bacterium]
MKFTEEHQMFRESLRRFIEKEINPFVEEWEQAEIFPAKAIIAKMGELGFLGVNYPEEYGGLGLDYWYNVIRAEELGRIPCGGVPMGISVHTDMCTPALADFGSHELRKKFLEPSIKGELLGAIGVTEPDAGSDVSSIRTRAESDGDHYVITGTKLYITNGTQADWICTLVRTSPGTGFDGMSLVIVPTDAPGFSVSRKLKKMGNYSSDTAELSFDRVRVPKWYRIGPEGKGFMLQMQQFQKERLVAAVMSYSAADLTIRRTIEYLKTRKAFGRPLIENQWIHFKLAELVTEVEMLRQMCYHCTRKLVDGEDMTREASMAKLKAGHLVRQVADVCIQFHGGMGYMEEYFISRYYRDSRLMPIGGGADEVMLGIIAKYEGILPERRKAEKA